MISMIVATLLLLFFFESYLGLLLGYRFCLQEYLDVLTAICTLLYVPKDLHVRSYVVLGVSSMCRASGHIVGGERHILKCENERSQDVVRTRTFLFKLKF